MTKDLGKIRIKLIEILKTYEGDLKIVSDVPEKFEVIGTKKAMQGKKEVDGFYFSSVVPKPKDIRLYFFPVYTHKDQLGELTPDLKKCLKGKSCFHIKTMDESMEKNFKDLVKRSIEIYKSDGLL